MFVPQPLPCFRILSRNSEKAILDLKTNTQETCIPKKTRDIAASWHANRVKMRIVGNTPERYLSRHTCQYKGRVFSFLVTAGKLTVVEIILGDRPEFVRVTTEETCGAAAHDQLACCSFDNYILVMVGHKHASTAEAFAYLFTMGNGQISRESMCFIRLVVCGDVKWPTRPYLCRFSDKCSLLHFYGCPQLWYCTIGGKELQMRELITTMPMPFGYEVVPVRLRDRELLIAGEYGTGDLIRRIQTADVPQVNAVGSIPGPGRGWTSIILVRNRFMIGFGGQGPDGNNFNDLWIFDTQLGKSAKIRAEGQLHPPSWLVAMAVHNNILYFIGGGIAFDKRVDVISSLPLVMLPELVQDREVSVALATAFLWERNAWIPELCNEIRALQADNTRLRQELEDAQKRLSVPSIRLPIAFPPAIPPPLKWKINNERFQSVKKELQRYNDTLSQNRDAWARYSKVPTSVRGKKSLRKLFCISAFGFVEKSQTAWILQVVSKLHSNNVVPSSSLFFRLLNQCSLRPMDKYTDRRTNGLQDRLDKQINRLMDYTSQLPPWHSYARAMNNEMDPLEAERRHCNFTRLCSTRSKFRAVYRAARLTN